MSYLELAQKALENCPRMKTVDAPNAEPRCEKSEKSEKSPTQTDADDDEWFVCRAIESDLGLLPGSLTLWEPVR